MSDAVTFNQEYAPNGAELGDWVYIDGANGEELWVLREVEVGPDPSIEGAQFSGKTYQWVNETSLWEWDPGKGDNYIFNGNGKKNLTTQYNTNKYVATTGLGVGDDILTQSSVKNGNKIYMHAQTESSDGSLRWPFDQIHADTDYVFFRFGQYRPPLGRESRSGASNAYDQYKYSSNLETVADVGPIMLPMPQDISNTLEQNWQGKQFSRVGMAALTGLATGNFSDMNNMLTGGGNWKAIQGSLIASGLIPGVGGNLTMSDVTGSTEGVVLNPNMEMLYDSPDIREVSMKYKLVPHNREEAIAIQKIIKQFRYAALPSWGAGDDLSEGLKNFSVKDSSDHSNDGEPIAENFIRVPWLCHFEFRTGGAVNPYVAQYKPCAITRVSINYTPDGTYASYLEGGPSAYEIDLSFIETKLIFKQDLADGGIY